jgi:hypothetical protein
MVQQNPSAEKITNDDNDSETYCKNENVMVNPNVKGKQTVAKKIWDDYD